MKGLEICVKFALLSEKKWDANGFDFQDLAKEFSPADQKVVKALRYVADGELTGIGVLLQLCDASRGKFQHFYEAIYFMMTIVYEEFRHGMTLRGLNQAVDGLENFVKCIPASEAVDGICIRPVWNDPYDALVSLTVGEITNVILYREAAGAAVHPRLKELLLNISRDELRHKTGWREICKKLVSESEETRALFIAAYRRAHCVHQAEGGNNYRAGLIDTRGFFTPDIVEEIHREKLALLRSIVGDDIGFDEREFRDSQLRYVLQKLQSGKSPGETI